MMQQDAVVIPMAVIQICLQAVRQDLCGHAGGVASLLLRSKRHLAQLGAKPDLPKLLILGDCDQFSSLASLHKIFTPEQHFTEQQNEAYMDQSKTTIVTMHGSDHFFLSQRAEVAKKIMQYCVNLVNVDVHKRHAGSAGKSLSLRDSPHLEL